MNSGPGTLPITYVLQVTQVEKDRELYLVATIDDSTIGLSDTVTNSLGKNIVLCDPCIKQQDIKEGEVRIEMQHADIKKSKGRVVTQYYTLHAQRISEVNRE